MCNCHSDVEKKLTAMFTEQAPAGSEQFEIELQGFLFSLVGNTLTHRSSSAVHVSYMAPKKSGGMKKVNQKTFVRASYCPFCGESYSKAEEASEKLTA